MVPQTCPLQYFASSPAPAVPPADSPGIGRTILNGVKSLFFIPARWGAEEAVQGVANRSSQLFNHHQAEFTERMRAVFNNALLRHTPDHYHLLLRHILAFRRNPSTIGLDLIKTLLDKLTREEIQSLSPEIQPDGINLLLNLKNALLTQVVVDPTQALIIPEDTLKQLELAEGILKILIENHEGILFQTMNALTQSMSTSDGPVAALRQQLLDPQQGVLSQVLALLKNQLTSKATPLMRETKESLNSYLSTLNSSAADSEVKIAAQKLAEKIGSLLAQKGTAPQIQESQWTQISQFAQALSIFPDPFPSRAQLQSQVDPINQLIIPAFNAQRGVIEEAADVLVEGIGRGVEHLVQLPKRMLSETLSTTGPSASTTPPSTLPNSRGWDLGSIATRGQNLLNAVLTSAGSSCAQLAASSLSTLAKWTFEKLKHHIEQSGENSHLLSTINPFLDRLQNPGNDLNAVLAEAFQFMRNQQVYLQGFRLPLNSIRDHTSAIPNFLDNVNAHEERLRPLSQRVPERITSEKIQEQADLLKVRFSAYGPTLFVAEKICGLEVSPAFYAEIFSATPSGDETDLKTLFRQRFFQKIDRSSLNFFTKWFAKIAYDLALPLSTFYVQSMTDNVFTTINQWISSESAHQPKDEFLVKLIRNWMAVMSGAYNAVADTSHSQSEDFDKMMERVIKDPKRNGGLTQQELYAAVIKTAIDTFGPQIRWGETLNRYFSSEIPSSSPFHFLNPVVKILSTCSNFLLQGLVFIPQWAGNHLIKGIAKIAVSHTPVLKDYAENAIDSLKRNTPASYAAQKLIYQQLQKVLATLQKNLNSDASLDGTLSNRNNNIKSVEIESLVKYGLEILNKGQYRTQDSLRDYLKHRAPLRNRVEHELESTFLPEAMETAVQLISDTLQLMTQEQEMQEMVYNGLKMGNDMFNVTEPVSDKDFAALEKGVQELNAQILETAIFHAIGEKFDFNNEKQKKAISQAMKTLKDQTQDFSTQIAALTQEIETDASLSIDQLQSKIHQLMGISSKYNKDRVDAQSMIDGNRNFHTETKYRFNELSKQLASRCTPLSVRINGIKTLSDTTKVSHGQLNAIVSSMRVHRSIKLRLSDRSSLEDIQFAKTQFTLLKEHLSALRSYECPEPIANELHARYEDYSATLNLIEGLHKERNILEQARSLFNELKNLKMRNLASVNSNQMKQLQSRLNQLLQGLPEGQLRSGLQGSIQALMEAQESNRVSLAYQNFSQVCTERLARNAERLRLCRQPLSNIQTSLDEKLQQAMTEFSRNFSRASEEIRQQMTEVRTDAATMNEWVASQHDFPLFNIFAFDMQWVTEIITNIAFDRAKMKTKLLFDALYQGYNYTGLINQVVLLPFLKRFGNQHLLG